MKKHTIAAITGASGIIGKTIAKSFAQDGYQLLLIGKSAESLCALKAELMTSTAARVECFAADVSNEGQVREAMEFAKMTFGSLDALITAAGVYGEIGTIEQCTPSRWLDAILVNLFGTMLCVTYALPLLKKSSRGKIIAFAGGGEGPLPRFSSYAASKGGVLRFVESVAKELEPFRIDINAISPGLVNSGLQQELIAAGPVKAGREKYDAAVNETKGKAETVSPERAAALALFLASEKSDGITGKNISAVWDAWNDLPLHKDELSSTDIYNWRRIKPRDRGSGWK